MKNKKILIIMIITMLFTGCSAAKGNGLLREGKHALERHEYTKAKDILSQVLTADSSNEDARSMYIQAVKMSDVATYEEQKRYEKAIECLEAIEKLNGGSSEIKKEASKKKKELIKLNEEYQKAKEDRKENAKEASSQGKYKLEQDAINANQKEEEVEENTEEQQEDQNVEENKEENNTNQNTNEENNQSGNTQENGGSNDEGSVQTPSTQQSQQEPTPQQ